MSFKMPSLTTNLLLLQSFQETETSKEEFTPTLVPTILPHLHLLSHTLLPVQSTSILKRLLSVKIKTERMSSWQSFGLLVLKFPKLLEEALTPQCSKTLTITSLRDLKCGKTLKLLQANFTIGMRSQLTLPTHHSLLPLKLN